MERLELFQNENAPKGNSEDSLLVIYILQILKKYSSPKNPLSSQDVMDHLRKDYSFGDFDEADPKRKEKAAAQQKKVRRLLDTLYEFNGKSAVIITDKFMVSSGLINKITDKMGGYKNIAVFDEKYGNKLLLYESKRISP